MLISIAVQKTVERRLGVPWVGTWSSCRRRQPLFGLVQTVAGGGFHRLLPWPLIC